MNVRQVRDLALKILGICFLSNAFVRSPQFAGIILSWRRNPGLAEHAAAVSLLILLPLAFWLMVGLLLTFRTGLVAAILWPSRDEPESGAVAMPPLRFWVVLIGFFFLVNSAGGAVTQLWTFIVRRDLRESFMYYHYLPGLITLILSFLCIMKAKTIEAWLTGTFASGSNIKDEF